MCWINLIGSCLVGGYSGGKLERTERVYTTGNLSWSFFLRVVVSVSSDCLERDYHQLVNENIYIFIRVQFVKRVFYNQYHCQLCRVE